LASGAQAPVQGITLDTHPHLFQKPYKVDARHVGQFWMGQGIERPASVHLPPVHGVSEVVSAAVLTDPEAAQFADVRAEVLEHGRVRGSCELLRLGVGKGSMPHFFQIVQYDIMHVVAALIKDTFLGTLLGIRWSAKVKEIEQNGYSVPGRSQGGEQTGGRGRGGPSRGSGASTSRGRGQQSGGRGARGQVQGSGFVGRFSEIETDGGPGCLPQEGLDELEAALRRLAELGGDFARLERVLDASKKFKSHTLFLLAGPCGLYALACVRRYLPFKAVYETLVRLLQACHLLWSKEVHVHSIPTLRAFVYEAVCAVELFLPVSERDIKLHELTELASQIELWGERFLLSRV